MMTVIIWGGFTGILNILKKKKNYLVKYHQIHENDLIEETLNYYLNNLVKELNITK